MVHYYRYLGLRRVVALCRLEDLQEGGVGGIAPPAAGASQEKGAGHHQPHAGNEFGEQDAADLFVFDAQGLLVSQKTQVSRQVGK